MPSSAPITLGIDPGVHHTGWAVLNETIMAAGCWDLRDRPSWASPEAYLRGEVLLLRYRHRVRLLAIEAFHWRGRVSTQAPAMYALIGALRSLAGPHLDVVEYRAADWQEELMGRLPKDRRFEHRYWKAALRTQVGLALGYAWPLGRRGAPLLYHDSDAAGLALVARARAHLAQRIASASRGEVSVLTAPGLREHCDSSKRRTNPC